MISPLHLNCGLSQKSLVSLKTCNDSGDIYQSIKSPTSSHNFSSETGFYHVFLSLLERTQHTTSEIQVGFSSTKTLFTLKPVGDVFAWTDTTSSVTSTTLVSVCTTLFSSENTNATKRRVSRLNPKTFGNPCYGLSSGGPKTDGISCKVVTHCPMSHWQARFALEDARKTEADHIKLESGPQKSDSMGVMECQKGLLQRGGCVCVGGGGSVFSPTLDWLVPDLHFTCANFAIASGWRWIWTETNTWKLTSKAVRKGVIALMFAFFWAGGGVPGKRQIWFSVVVVQNAGCGEWEW